jgi:hypothetical protein
MTAGLYASSEVAYLVARQNGKGAALEAIALHGLFLVGDPLTLWTAHQFKTSSEAFIRVRGWIDGSDELRPLVKRINAAHGEEGIELHAGRGCGSWRGRSRLVVGSRRSGSSSTRRRSWRRSRPRRCCLRCVRSGTGRRSTPARSPARRSTTRALHTPA